MNPRKQTEPENAPGAPVWILTYSDMVTLLLTFFVLVVSMAHGRGEEAMFKSALDSFRQAIIGFGLPGFSYGKLSRPSFGNVKLRYAVEAEDRPAQFTDRLIDARQQHCRLLFRRLSEFARTAPSQITGKRADFPLADIHFDAGAATLNESAKRSLTAFSSALQENPGSAPAAVYIAGLARSQAPAQQQWILSAQRAHAVADFLGRQLPADWPIYCWGAGPGKPWAPAPGPAAEQPDVLIAVLRPDSTRPNTTRP